MPSLKRNKVQSLDTFDKKSKQTDNDNNESKEVGGILFANVLQNTWS